MKSKYYAILATCLASCFLFLSGCGDGTVSEDEASRAGEILKKWQDQNR